MKIWLCQHHHYHTIFNRFYNILLIYLPFYASNFIFNVCMLYYPACVVQCCATVSHSIICQSLGNTLFLNSFICVCEKKMGGYQYFNAFNLNKLKNQQWRRFSKKILRLESTHNILHQNVQNFSSVTFCWKKMLSCNFTSKTGRFLVLSVELKSWLSVIYNG